MAGVPLCQGWSQNEVALTKGQDTESLEMDKPMSLTCPHQDSLPGNAQSASNCLRETRPSAESGVRHRVCCCPESGSWEPWPWLPTPRHHHTLTGSGCAGACPLWPWPLDPWAAWLSASITLGSLGATWLGVLPPPQHSKYRAHCTPRATVCLYNIPKQQPRMSLTLRPSLSSCFSLDSENSCSLWL